MSPRCFSLPLLLLLLAAGLSAQSLLKDVATGTVNNGSNPAQFTTMGGVTYFVANTLEHGTELWKSDGTAGGTSLVLELDPGPHNTSTNLQIHGELGSQLYFVADLPGMGTALWRTNGTAGGTTMVTALSGSSVYDVRGVTTSTHLFFLTRSTTTLDLELWTTDGTAGGTFNLSVAKAVDDVNGLFALGSTVYFMGQTAAAGFELWKTDGTAVGTVMVTDLNAGAGAGVANPFGSGGIYPHAAAFNGELYFMGNNGTSGYELWKTDGTAAGTQLVLDINSGSADSHASGFAVHAGELFFRANSASGVELWKSDGTAGGTVLVRDINTTGSSDPSFLTSTPAGLVFRAFDSGNGYEPWISDGTTAGTTILKDVVAGSFDSNPRTFEVLGSHVYFEAYDGVSPGTKLWRSDGTAAGTVQVGGTYGYIYYTYLPELHSDGTRLWFTDGELCAATGTTGQVVANLSPDVESLAGAVNGDRAVLGSNLYFSNRADLNYNPANIELWSSNGTTAGTLQLADINPGAGGSEPWQFLAHNGYVFFSATDGTSGVELWRTDGTSGGTLRLVDLEAGAGDSYARPYGVIGANVVFLGETSGGLRIGLTNGTVAGTSSFSVAGVAYHQGGCVINNRLFFVSDNYELWTSDGTQAGTVLLTTASPASPGGYDLPMFLHNGLVYFAANNVTNGIELWKTDGTPGGTAMVHDIWAGQFFGVPDLQMGVVNNVLLFAANNGTSGNELWTTNGTSGGTSLFFDINPGARPSNPSDFTLYNGQLFFTAETASSGRELWVTDGTVGGTSMLTDIYAGALSSNPGSLYVWNGLLYFAAATAADGMELWSTDGTVGGTQQVANLLTGAGNSAPYGFIDAGTRMYFSAFSPTSGREFWTYSNVNTAPQITAATAVTIAPGASQPGAAIATVSDGQDAAGSLTVTATSVPAGITISAITNSTGAVTADITVSAGATLGANLVTLQVQDSGGLTATALFTVNVGSAPSGGSGGGGGGGGGGCAAEPVHSPWPVLALLVFVAIGVTRRYRRA